MDQSSLTKTHIIEMKETNRNELPAVTYDVRKTAGQETSVSGGMMGLMLTTVSLILILVTLPLSIFACFEVIQEYERAVIFRHGRLRRGGAKGPGVVFIIPCVDNYRLVDLRTISFDVPPQKILTKDSISVDVDAVVYYHITNAEVAVSNVVDYCSATRLLASTTLRNAMGTLTLSEILGQLVKINEMTQSVLDNATNNWGVKVERVDIKNVRIPNELQRAMAAEAEATREARAKLIDSEGEQMASRALAEAARILSDSPASIQLRYLQTLSSIATEKNQTIIFPIPIDLIKNLMLKDD